MTETLKSIRRGDRLIKTLLSCEAASVSELAERMDMPLSTAYDYVKTFESLGYVIELPDGRYKVSTGFLELGNRIRNQYAVYRVAEPELKALARSSGEYVPLMIEEAGLGVILSMNKGDKSSNITIRETYSGTKTRLSTTAPGKAILANLPERRIRSIIDRYGLAPKTEYTITDLDVLFDELEQIREQGYAIDDEERFDGMRGIGAPIDNDVTGAPAAISIYGPAHRLTEAKLHDELSSQLLEVANVIQVNLTYS